MTRSPKLKFDFLFWQKYLAQSDIFIFLQKYYSRQIYSYDFCILKPNNLKVIHDLCYQCLIQTLSKTIFFSSMEGVPPTDQAHDDLMLEKIGGIIVYLPANQEFSHGPCVGMCSEPGLVHCANQSLTKLTKGFVCCKTSCMQKVLLLSE